MDKRFKEIDTNVLERCKEMDEYIDVNGFRSVVRVIKIEDIGFGEELVTIKLIKNKHIKQD